MKINLTDNKYLPVALLLMTVCVISIYPYVTARGNTGSGDVLAGSLALPTKGLSATTNVRPKIEVVFVLDTTSSMSGMIQAAKDNIWSIASTMASAQPAPEIKMGLVAFRDRGDEYVTKVFDLSEDLDSMYATLMDFQAQGGGDGPESVNQALHEAVTRVSWSEEPDNYRVIFLVGDAPPHMDYQNDVQYPQSVKLAASKGIVVNTIQAGNDTETSKQWQRIASLSQGDYFNVADNGTHIALLTPFDKQIAELSAELDRTRVYYGSKAEQAKRALKVAAADKLHAAASVASRAKRALYNASESGVSNLFGTKELLTDIESGEVVLDELNEAELPESIRAMPAEEREQALLRQSEQRRELSEKISALAKKRDAYVQNEIAKEEFLDESLDQQIFETVVKQTKDKGLRYEGGVKY